MKKFILLLILLSVTVVAQAECQAFIDKAESYITDPAMRAKLPYPIDFAIGQEYFHGAECFEKAGSTVATINYELASNHYLVALNALAEGTDYSLKAQTYEQAAIANTKLGKTELAAQYYNRAIDNLNVIGATQQKAELAEQAADTIRGLDQETAVSLYQTAIENYESQDAKNRVRGKLSAMTQAPVPMKEETATNFIVILGILAIVPIIFLIVFFLEKGKQGRPSMPRMPEIRKHRHTTEVFAPKAMERPRPAPQAKPKVDRSVMAREKMAKKLRGKYRP